MVKADAYGHGDIQIAKAAAAEGVESLGVALIEEGVRLREAGVSVKEILVFHPNLDELSAQALARYNLTPVISSWHSLQVIQKLHQVRKLNLHLKFNTGMNRLGFRTTETQKLGAVLRSESHLNLVGICTHFINGEDWGSENSYTAMQCRLFQDVLKSFSGLKLKIHAMNSSALIAGHCTKQLEKFQFGARPGIALYGARPDPFQKDLSVIERLSQIDVKPVMSVHSEVALVQAALEGEAVSYGPDFKCARQSLIGVVPIGYADGYRRAFSNRSRMLFQNQYVPVRGRVCMDSTMIDLTDLDGSADQWMGDEVVLMGSQGPHEIRVEELANIAGTNTYEIFTDFSSRLPRVYQ